MSSILPSAVYYQVQPTYWDVHLSSSHDGKDISCVNEILIKLAKYRLFSYVNLGEVRTMNLLLFISSIIAIMRKIFHILYLIACGVYYAYSFTISNDNLFSFLARESSFSGFFLFINLVIAINRHDFFILLLY